jgi:hypothetical protein
MTLTNDEMTVEQRVSLGASFLDEVASGWEGRINLETLRLASPEQCICGQTFGTVNGYYGFFYFVRNLLSEGRAWVEAFGMDPQDGYELAYQMGFSRNDDHTNPSWADLQDAWTSLIKTRYDTGALSA